MTIPSGIHGVHPFADKYPMRPEDALADLAESIAAKGLRSPIVITPDGLILDGRHRYKACAMAGVQPTVTEYAGDDLAEYVIDANLTRPNMSTGARAMATALVLQADGRRSDRRWRGSLVITESGHRAAQWRQRLTEAGVILDFQPDLAEAVVSAGLSLSAAYDQADALRAIVDREQILQRETNERDKDRAKAEADRVTCTVADLTQAGERTDLDQVDAETLTPAQAWAGYLECTCTARAVSNPAVRIGRSSR